ncbi:MAG TPA: hypothetical protein PKW44_05445 [Methylophilaceae bacterium]|nr:hypothetical protein [Methylophilaceae bacterium]
MKKLGLALLVLIVIVASALLWLRGNLDGLVRDAIAKYGSEMTQARVSVDGVKISAASGKGIISGLAIGNPKGFKTPRALNIQEFTVAIDPATIAGDVVTVKKIAIIAPNVVYEKGETMTNFDAIQNNIANYLGPSDNKTSEGGKKLIVEKLTIRGARAEVSAAFMDGKTVTVDLPDLTLRNMGKAKGGITPGELGQEIAGALQKQLAHAVNFDKIGKAIGESASATAKEAAEASGKAVDKVKSLF